MKLMLQKTGTYSWKVLYTPFEIRESQHSDLFYIVTVDQPWKYVSRDMTIVSKMKTGQEGVLETIMYESVEEALGVLQLYMDNVAMGA